jgi:tetratricopeptide (TPR) repeat protein
MSSAMCYSERIDADAHWDEELHGMDYLVYAYLQVGNNEKALEQYGYLKTFKKVFPENFKVAYTAAAVPTRIALENKDWNAAANLQLPSIAIDWNSFPWQQSILRFGKALGDIHIGNLDQAQIELSIMKDFHQHLHDIDNQYQANQVMIQIKMIQGWLAFANNQSNESIMLMKEALNMENSTSKHPVTPGEVLPAGELLGDLFMNLSKPKEALDAYEADLLIHPNRFNGIYGAGSAAAALSNHGKAVKYFEQLVELCKHSNSNRAELVEAREYLSKHKT